MTTSTTRHLNFTRRQRIGRDLVDVRIRRSTDGPLLSASVELERFDLEPTARVVVEAYRQSVIERVDMGLVADNSRIEGHTLSSFADGTSILCRIKVIAEATGGGHGLILAVADKLRPESDYDDEGGRSLLPFREDASLGQRIWRLDTAGDSPVVLVNPEIGDWRDYARRPAFTALVLPEILGRICRWVARNPIDEKEDSPAKDWKDFLIDLGADFSEVDPEMEEDSLDVWVDDLVFTFCSRHHFRDQLAEILEGDDR